LIHLFVTAALAATDIPIVLPTHNTLHGAHGGTVRLTTRPAFEGEPGEPCRTEFSVTADGSIVLGASTCTGHNAYDVVAGLGELQIQEVTLAEGQEAVSLALQLQFLSQEDGTTEVTYADVHAPTSDESTIVHWSEVSVKRRVSPKYPEEAKQYDLGEVRCELRFLIDEKGIPYEIRPESCPEMFQESALDAAWKWTFYPMKKNGEPVKAQFVLMIVYRLR
jgi:hypothetical protein